MEWKLLMTNRATTFICLKKFYVFMFLSFVYITHFCVVPNSVNFKGLSTSTSWVCPPETVKAIKGNVGFE